MKEKKRKQSIFKQKKQFIFGFKGSRLINPYLKKEKLKQNGKVRPLIKAEEEQVVF